MKIPTPRETATRTSTREYIVEGKSQVSHEARTDASVRSEWVYTQYHNSTHIHDRSAWSDSLPAPRVRVALTHF